MYSVNAYGKMLIDEIRTQAYVRALKQTVRPGATVLDIGTGPGYFALLACKLGASRVYAIEPDAVIELAMDCARHNGFSDRIEFIQDVSTNVSLPEPIDVIVADLRGVLPFYGTNLPSLKDAHDRFLSPHGVLIPARDHLYAALVQAPSKYEKIEAPWTTLNDVSLSSIRRIVMNNWQNSRGENTELLCDPLHWHTINYSQIDDFDVDTNITFVVTQPGTAHGIALWFVSDLCDGVTLSTAPDQPELIYGKAFIPLLHPIEVTPGKRINLRLRADLVNDDYTWSWETKVDERQNPDTPKIHFKQSNFLGVPISPHYLRKRSSGFTPVLTDKGEITSFILLRTDGKTTNQQLAEILKKEFPERFANDADALDAVAEVSAEYSK